MANTSSQQAGLLVNPAQTHRSEILENPLRVSLFKLSVWSGGGIDKAVVFLAFFLMCSILFYLDYLFEQTFSTPGPFFNV